MQNRTTADARRSVLLSLVVLGLLSALIIVPYQFRSEAGNVERSKRGLVTRTESHDSELGNYDIRIDKQKEAITNMKNFRSQGGKTASNLAESREQFVRGEEDLRTRIKTLKVEYNDDMRIPEVIGTNVWADQIESLTGSSGMKRSDILRNFAKQNNQLIGMQPHQIDDLEIIADYVNPDGSMAFAHFEQRINGIPVFRGEIKAGFAADGRMIRVINNLAPGLEYESLSEDFGDPREAAVSAYRHINKEISPNDLPGSGKNSYELRTVFGESDFSPMAEKMYFPTESGVARAAWRVLIWQPTNAYYVIVDAETGTMLWRKNIAEDQNTSATYGVYRNSNGVMDVADSPAPISPGPINPGTGTQGTFLSRTDVSLIGNEGLLSFNNNGWITDGNNTTDGNAVQAGLDRELPNAGTTLGVGDIDPTGMATGNPNRVFSFVYNPLNPNDNSGDAPTPNSPTTCSAMGTNAVPTAYQQGAVTQLFYITNRYHDSMYLLGFNEQARNFQNDNFGRGGNANDRISAQAQDCSGTNNANMITPSDGTRGQMQMYIFTGPTPDSDGDLDAEVVVHELTHGTTNRLVGNAGGLNTNMARGMGEGWSDFYAHALLAESTDPINGIYTSGAYITYNSFGLGTTNSYYGIRRFPKAVFAFTGGPMNRPHNPLTFADLNVGCNLNDGAFAPAFTGTCDQVHNAGEIWSSFLWEVRALMITRLGFAAGSDRALQVVTNGLKMTPNSPNSIQARDAIIAAAQALPLAPEASADAIDVREGFRVRGMGFSASVTSASQPAVVVEAFDFPNVQHVDPFSVSDSTGDNDGFPEPGENVLFSVPVTNTTGATINNVQVNVSGGTNTSYGNINDGQTVTMQIPYFIPGGATCGNLHQVAINVSSDVGAQTPVTRSFRLGVPSFSGTTQNFDSVTPPALPAGWQNVQLTGTSINWVTSSTSSNTAPNSAFANNATTVNDTALVANAQITSATPQISFRNFYNLEGGTTTGFDGMVMEYSTNGTTWTDVCPSCATICPGASCPFVSNGYNLTISSSFGSPIGGRRAWSGNAGSYLDTVVNLPAALNGQTVGLRWRVATDSSLAAVGANIDTISLTGGTFQSGYACQVTGQKPRADFDGDGKTDRSVFRPSEGNWYVDASTAGFSVTRFGISTDTPVPGDYDGDGKADWAVFRPSDTPGVPDFFILSSDTMTFQGVQWGLTGDIPLSGDYDGDGKADPTVFRPSTSTWYTLNLVTGTFTIAVFGSSGDIPMVMDHDGDGKANLAVFRPGNTTWYIARATGTPATNFDAFPFGLATDKLVPADYDGDNKDDVAVFRPSNGTWYILNSGNGTTSFIRFGSMGDIPVVGDWDGDGSDDIGIYRNGQWWTRGSTAGVSLTTFGLSTDTAIPSKYVP